MERPFLLDSVWDIVILLDYLETRPDVDSARIGITGVSLGGMHSWLAAALDERIAVAAPMIGVQVRLPSVSLSQGIRQGGAGLNGVQALADRLCWQRQQLSPASLVLLSSRLRGLWKTIGGMPELAVSLRCSRPPLWPWARRRSTQRWSEQCGSA